jgi:S-adenosylmethionine-dependent methyltransferase
MSKDDQTFDGIANKFVHNIYGTSKGKLRHLLLCDLMGQRLADGMPLRVIDVGGGTGIMSRFLAELGHDVTLSDASEDILAIAKEADVAQRLTIRHEPILAISDLDTYDLVLCHAVLEWLGDPQEAIGYLATQMRPGASLSLSFFNRDAALFSNALYGNFDYIARGMKVKNQVRLNPQSPLRPADVIGWVTELGLTIDQTTGIRCFHDYMRDKTAPDRQFDELYALERQYNQTEPFCWLGKYLHLWLTKPSV